MLRRFLSPRWILGHLATALLVVLLVNLGLWQLRRLDDRREANDRVTERSTLAPVAGSADLFDTGDTAALEWRPVTVTGLYDAANVLVILGRSDGGTAGTHSLVPLRGEDGSVWLVNRGFVPLVAETPAPPEGSVTVTGWLRSTQTRRTLGAIDSTDPGAVEYHRFDVELISRRLEGDVAPMWLQLATEEPRPAGASPAPVPLPPLDEGSHLSYAGQWFRFAAIAAGGWIVVLRRAARNPPSRASA